MNIAVIFGGNSVEHEISIISAQQAIAQLKDSNDVIIPIYLSKDMKFYYGEKLDDISNFSDLKNIIGSSTQINFLRKDNKVVIENINKKIGNRAILDIDVVMPIVHGTNVEDGTLAGYLNALDIPFVFSKHIASSISQDKVFQKQVLIANDINVVDYKWFYDDEINSSIDEVMDEIEKLSYPVIVKPNTLGSSVGIEKASNREELEMALTNSIKFDNKILVEKMLPSIKEVNISLRGSYDNIELSKTEQVGDDDEFLTYSDKYQSGGSKKTGQKSSSGMASLDRIIPANIPDEQIKQIELFAKKAFRVVGNSGLIRIDFMIDSTTNKVYLNEINSIPGSLSYYLWEATGVSFKQLLNDLIKQAIKDYSNKSKLQFSFDTNVLELQSK